MAGKSATTAIAIVSACVPLFALADPPAAATGQQLEQIVVNARRRGEQAQSVPMAITVLSQKDIEQDRILDIADLAKYAPSLSSYDYSSDANNYSASKVRLRGLFGTVVYFDDVPLGNVDDNPATVINQAKSPGFIYDIDNVAVLKGPQGTLFGRNSIGGLIDIQPKQPTDKYEGYAEGTLGNYGDKQFEGAINFPVVNNKLLIRVATQMQARDGYTKDISNGKDYDDRNYYATRVSILLRPSDDFQDYFVYDGYYQHTNGTATIPGYVNPGFVFGKIPLGSFGSLPLTLGDGPSVAGLSATNPSPTIMAALKAGAFSLFPDIDAILAEQRALGDREVTGRATPGIGKDYFFGFTNKSDWQLNDDLTIKHIAAARIYQQLTSIDNFGASLPVLATGSPTNNTGWNEDSIHYSEELQLQGAAAGDRLKWIIGAFFELDHPLAKTNEPSVQLGTLLFYHFYDTTRSEAGFTHASYDLGQYVPGLQFSAGYRYTWDYVSVNEVGFKNVPEAEIGTTGNPVNCAPVGYVNHGCGVNNASHFSAPGWNLSLDDQISPSWLTYIRSGSAYRPGFSNPQAPVGFQNVRPERVTDVEIGSKLDWQFLGRPARIDVDAFHTFYNAIQVMQFVAVPNQNIPGGTPTVADVTTNNGGASLTGAELESTFSPLPGLTVSPEVTYVNAAYTKYPAGEQAPPFFYQPNWQYGISGDYTYALGKSAGTLVASANYFYIGRQYIAPKGSDMVDSIAPHDNLNLALRWDGVMARPIDITFFMTNALDKTYVQAAVPLYNVIGFTSLVYNEPRMFGFSLTYHFG